MEPIVRPTGLKTGGKALWKSVAESHELDGTQIVQLTEACRAKDRLDKLDALLRGDISTWAKLTLTAGVYDLRVDTVLAQANNTANIMKQLIAALRLPDDKGKRPQTRPARGVYQPKTASALDRVRKAS